MGRKSFGSTEIISRYDHNHVFQRKKNQKQEEHASQKLVKFQAAEKIQTLKAIQ